MILTAAHRRHLRSVCKQSTAAAVFSGPGWVNGRPRSHGVVRFTTSRYHLEHPRDASSSCATSGHTHSPNCHHALRVNPNRLFILTRVPFVTAFTTPPPSPAAGGDKQPKPCIGTVTPLSVGVLCMGHLPSQLAYPFCGTEASRDHKSRAPSNPGDPCRLLPSKIPDN